MNVNISKRTICFDIQVGRHTRGKSVSPRVAAKSIVYSPSWGG